MTADIRQLLFAAPAPIRSHRTRTVPFQDVYDSAEVVDGGEAPRYYGVKYSNDGGGPRAHKFVASKEEVDADQGGGGSSMRGRRGSDL